VSRDGKCVRRSGIPGPAAVERLAKAVRLRPEERSWRQFETRRPCRGCYDKSHRGLFRDMLVVPSTVVEMVHKLSTIDEFGQLVQLQGTRLLPTDFIYKDVKVNGVDIIEVHTP